jgi:hypothetical protein
VVQSSPTRRGTWGFNAATGEYQDLVKPAWLRAIHDCVDRKLLDAGVLG